MNYSRDTNDILCTEEGKPAFKVAVIDKNGDLRMARGQADHREAVEKFLQEAGALIEDKVTGDGVSSADGTRAPAASTFFATAVSASSQASGKAPGETAKGGIPPCPEEDPTAGDKTPAVIAWWFEYHPEEAEKKYGHRKGTNITGVIEADAYDSSDRDADIARAVSIHDEE